MKKNMTTVLFSMIFLAGLSLLLYPFVANEWNNYRQSRLISSYDDAIAVMEAENEIDYGTEWKGAYESDRKRHDGLCTDSEDQCQASDFSHDQ